MNDNLLKKLNEVEKSHWWWSGRRELLKLIFSRKKPKRILDIGCGTGETLSYLKVLFPSCELYGVDLSLLAVRFSKERSHKNIYHANATKLSFKENFFDAVLFLDVLEHVNNHQKAIKEAKRVVKNGGMIIITSPALPFIWSNYDVSASHKRRYTKKEIKILAKKAGLKIAFISYFNFFLSLPIIIVRLLSRFKALNQISSYDNKLNFGIIDNRLVNSVLKSIFIKEIQTLKLIKYPFGISIVATLVKK